MDNSNISILKEGLEKKLEILKQIHDLCVQQSKLLDAELVSFEEFDKTVEQKSYLIFKLNKLDDGFQTVFDKTKKDLNENKDLYKEDIAAMQSLVKQVTELSNSIQALEQRNKLATESFFAKERSKIRHGRSGIKAIQNYSQSMSFKSKN